PLPVRPASCAGVPRSRMRACTLRQRRKRAVACDASDPASLSPREETAGDSGAVWMRTNTIIGMTRLRWRAARPFEGHTEESLLRKIQSPATREEIKEHARRELELRAARRLGS